MVSVIIPTYNREKTIVRAIQSVLNQTYTNIEVIVVDDGSVDNTAEIVGNIKDKRVKYISLEQNSGPSNARNVGVQNAKGEWIAFQDSDDVWNENKLQKQITYANGNPQFSMVYCPYKLILSNNESYVVPSKFYKGTQEGDMLDSLLIQNIIGTPTILIRKDAFKEVGGFDVSYRALEDWELVLRIAQKYKIGFVSEVLVNAYLLNGGVSSNTGAYYESRCRMVAEYRNEMERLGIFNIVLKDIFERAEHRGILDEVKKLVMAYLLGAS